MQRYTSTFFIILTFFLISFSNHKQLSSIITDPEAKRHSDFKISKKNSKVILDLMINQINLAEFKERQRLSIKGFSTSGKTGHPELPVKSFFLKVPEGHKVSFKILESRVREFTLGEKKIMPRKRPLGESSPEKETPISHIYEENRYLYEDVIKVKYYGKARGHDIAYVVVKVQFDKVSY
jgi:hypothetical protein